MKTSSEALEETINNLEWWIGEYTKAHTPEEAQHCRQGIKNILDDYAYTHPYRKEANQ